MLNPSDEKVWLDAAVPYMDFAFPEYQPNLEASPINTTHHQLPLF